MLKLIAKIDWKRVPKGLFITLTYPDAYWERDYHQRTIDRNRFIRDLEKYTGREFPIIWRVEWVPRQSGMKEGELAPHVHMMCLGVAFVPGAWVNHLWRTILDCKGDCVTFVRGIKGPEGCGRYLAKYISKAALLANAAYVNNPCMAGRAWGVHRPSEVPWSDVLHDREIAEEEYHAAVAAHIEMSTHAGAEAQDSFSILGEVRKDTFLKLFGERSCGPYLERL